MTVTAAAVAGPAADRVGVRGWYVLALLMLVYVVNFVDRQILTILAPFIKADLHIGDAQIGLLYGTSFALFYAVLGLPLARLADGWSRVRTLSIGLAFWSAMTSLSGLANGFGGLAAARIGVGVGEASASPAAYSILQDIFPPRRRATAIALYSSGIFIGAGLAGMIAAPVLGWWTRLQAAGAAPFDRSGWQMVFLVIGAPGLLLALLVWASVREPVRGARDGLPQPDVATPFRDMAQDFATLLPPFSIMALRRRGASEAVVRGNLLLLAACVVIATIAIVGTDRIVPPAKRIPIGHLGTIPITTNLLQWVALAIGGYACGSWLAMMAVRDRVAAALILATPALRLTIAANAIQNVAAYAFAGFAFLYGTQRVGLGAADAFAIGALVSLSGFLGTSIGGVLSDALHRRFVSGRLWLAIFCTLGSFAAFLWAMSATTKSGYLAAFFCAQMLGSLWFGPVSATIQSLVLPRLRGTATAVQFLAISLIGLGLGPYGVGLASDATGSLRTGLLGATCMLPVAALLYWQAARLLPAAATMIERARRAGEVIV